LTQNRGRRAVRHRSADEDTHHLHHRAPVITLVNADRIIVLREGRIVESGPHLELLRANGYYASLVRRQQHGMSPNDLTENAA
jgi:ABC-type transport system involved in Fe-S cluster assembly fused permease/ATPase subunit